MALIMKYLKYSVLLLVLNFSLAYGQQKELKVLQYEQLDEYIAAFEQQFLVLNFWATWCVPCVEELPYFMEINEQYKDDPNFKMLLVSLDQKKNTAAVLHFLKENAVSAESVLLDDVKRMNTWIPHYDANWDGSIPISLFYYKGKKVWFQNSGLNKKELAGLIEQYWKD